MFCVRSCAFSLVSTRVGSELCCPGPGLVDATVAVPQLGPRALALRGVGTGSGRGRSAAPPRFQPPGPGRRVGDWGQHGHRRRCSTYLLQRGRTASRELQAREPTVTVPETGRQCVVLFVSASRLAPKETSINDIKCVIHEIRLEEPCPAHRSTPRQLCDPSFQRAKATQSAGRASGAAGQDFRYRRPTGR